MRGSECLFPAASYTRTRVAGPRARARERRLEPMPPQPEHSRSARVGEGFPLLSILVCHSYFLRFDEKQRERAKPYPPLATLHVAALLRAAGHDVAVFDAMLADGNRGLPREAARCAARGRRVLRGQLQLPEQDVSRQDARGVLRDDRGRPYGRRPRRRRGLGRLGCPRSVSRGRRRCRTARRGACGADGARRPARRRSCARGSAARRGAARRQRQDRRHDVALDTCRSAA